MARAQKRETRKTYGAAATHGQRSAQHLQQHEFWFIDKSTEKTMIVDVVDDAEPEVLGLRAADDAVPVNTTAGFMDETRKIKCIPPEVAETTSFAERELRKAKDAHARTEERLAKTQKMKRIVEQDAGLKTYAGRSRLKGRLNIRKFFKVGGTLQARNRKTRGLELPRRTFEPRYKLWTEKGAAGSGSFGFQVSPRGINTHGGLLS